MKVKSQHNKENKRFRILKGVGMFCILSVTGCAQTGLLGTQESAPIESRSSNEQALNEQRNPPPKAAEIVKEDAVISISPLDDDGVGLPEPIDAESVDRLIDTPAKRLPTAPMPASNAATVQILGDAQAALVKGDLQAAESVTNRGLRIAPKDPALWLQLAKIRLGQGEYLEAISLSERAQVLAADNPAAQVDALEIIATAYDSVGEIDKAAAAREKIRNSTGEMGVR